MAVGKSTVGPGVAAALGRPFVDLDARVEASAGCSVRTLFEREGEGGFRAWEHAALRALLPEQPSVVALGGGTVVNDRVRSEVRSAGTLVTLNVLEEELRRRLAGGHSRPLAQGADPLALRAVRAEAYADADVQVHLDGLDRGAAVAAVVEALPESFAAEAAGVRTGRNHGVGPADRSDAVPMPARVGVAATLPVEFAATPARTCPVHFGLGIEASLAEFLSSRWQHVVLVTDARVAPLHGVRLAERLQSAGLRVTLLVTPEGEAHKTLAAVGALAEQALQARVDRGAVVVALGGGVVGDVAGLLAALLLRGLPCVQVPTTVLAQVDSSVGGKTAVNHAEGKNLLGVFAQPVAVFVDVAYLDTLPHRERVAGLAEVIKHGALADPSLIDAAVAVARSGVGATRAMLDLVRRAVAIKAAVVAEDEREAGPRRMLNFGHTVGHALEAAHLDTLRHGEAVSLGMVAAVAISRDWAGLSAAESEKLIAALRACGLPVDLAAWLVPSAINRVALDKKVRGEYVDLVLLDGLGHPVIRPFAIDALRLRLRAMRTQEMS
jgi:shikimate kinase/3-dehydroquinate synthase